MTETVKTDLNDIIALLEEAQGFAAMSPAGRANIAAAISMLEDAAEESYRNGFSDGEKHFADKGRPRTRFNMDGTYEFIDDDPMPDENKGRTVQRGVETMKNSSVIEIAKIIAWHHRDRKQWSGYPAGPVGKRGRNDYYAENEYKTFLPAAEAVLSAIKRSPD